MQIHVVQAGDTVEGIAAQYGVNAASLIFNNQLATPSRLAIGQALLILQPSLTHVVRPGESLSGIARLYDIPPIDLVRNNPVLLTRSNLLAGETLVIYTQDERLGTLEVDGYAYPFIQNDVLWQTMPYLTSLLPFSYGFTADGGLVLLDDEALRLTAAQFGAETRLVLTPLDAEGKFNNGLITALVRNPEAQQRLTRELLAAVQARGFAGVDVDFEFVEGEDRIDFTEFVRMLTQAMNAAGYTVSVALAPRESAEQVSRVAAGIDYPSLGMAANQVLLMTYEWGYTYGPPMAVAPLNKVRQIVDYALTVIPTEKIHMGMPNYGYDWPLPYIRGATMARSIGNVEAVNIAVAQNAVIRFDEVAQTPFFEYSAEGVDHIVWFEDVRSIRAKVLLALEKGLAGLGYWNIMRPFLANWLLLNAMVEIG